jgi:hypothetical protein
LLTLPVLLRLLNSTSVGLYSTDNLTTNNPVWQREGANTLGFAVIQSMAHRPSDNVLVIGTHGNGMYYTSVGKTINTNPGSGIFIESVSPTLATSFVNYRVGNLSSVQTIIIRIFNMKGQLLFKEERAYSNASLDFTRYPAGMYIISFFSNDGEHKFTQKIIRQ